ncbi:lactonase family protein [Rhodobium gokarnense]|uniref:6-phosphogluconolactonase n=1 Tax=Rhodobium gokarnense TaxID=364296 RepID=A0ABT3HDL6_9HYPH|nr:lactonase family protein [Rhodobium gokarnense]MCW2308498.1 6-phosphogluconolactonase [Rhodobium gokarnense]
MADSTCLLAVGGVNRPIDYFERAEGTGISIFSLDEDTGAWACLSQTGDIDNPTFLAVDPAAGRVFASSEVWEWNEGLVSAYKLDPATGALTYINKQVVPGSLTAHLWLDRSGRYVLATNYSHETPGELPGQAMAVFPVREDGGLLPASASVKHEGSGPNPDRQSFPHPHSAIASPENDLISVADLGCDRLFHYAFDTVAGTLTPAADAETVLPPGAGPRHFLYAPDGRHLYVITELTSAIVVYRREGGRLEGPVFEISTLPEDVSGESQCADIQVSADGRFLYGSNRGHDSIACFSVDRESGALEAIGHAPCGGTTPRNFAITPSGRHMVVANQDSDSIAVFAIDPETGLLSDTGWRLPVGSPTCVKAFVPKG